MSELHATVQDYEVQLQALLPPGPAWSEPDVLLAGIALECSRIHGRLLQLIEEADPRTTTEMLGDWERVAGLPNACMRALEVDQTFAQRIGALVAHLTATGGQSIPYYVSVAAALGYSVTIDEFPIHTVLSDVNAALNAPPWQYVWRINSQLITSGGFSVISPVIEPLSWFGNEALECVLKAIAPAHTLLLFNYV